jgi:hypothetical protein
VTLFCLKIIQKQSYTNAYISKTKNKITLVFVYVFEDILCIISFLKLKLILKQKEANIDSPLHAGDVFGVQEILKNSWTW